MRFFLSLLPKIIHQSKMYNIYTIIILSRFYFVNLEEIRLHYFICFACMFCSNKTFLFLYCAWVSKTDAIYYLQINSYNKQLTNWSLSSSIVWLLTNCFTQTNAKCLIKFSMLQKKRKLKAFRNVLLSNWKDARTLSGKLWSILMQEINNKKTQAIFRNDKL